MGAEESVRLKRRGVQGQNRTYLPLQVGTYPSITNTTVQDHLEIYHVIGDPTLQLWTELPHLVRLRAWLMGKGSLRISLSSCPNDAVVTVMLWDKILRRIEPTSNHLTVNLRGLIPPVVQPRLIRRLRLKVCFSAPDCRYQEVWPRQLPSPPVHFP